VSVPSAPALNPGAGTITLTIRMRTTLRAAAPDWDLIRKGVFGDAGGDYKVEYQPSGQASCGFIDASGVADELIAGPPLDDGAWHTVRCAKTPSAIVLVIDGQPFSKPARIGSIANSADLVIGAHGGTSEFFQGALDEAMVQVQ
jgi:hypothetical protein